MNGKRHNHVEICGSAEICCYQRAQYILSRNRPHTDTWGISHLWKPLNSPLVDPHKTTERVAGMIPVGSVHPYAMSLRSCHNSLRMFTLCTGRGEDDGGRKWRRTCGEVESWCVRLTGCCISSILTDIGSCHDQPKYSLSWRLRLLVPRHEKPSTGFSAYQSVGSSCS